MSKGVEPRYVHIEAFMNALHCHIEGHWQGPNATTTLRNDASGFSSTSLCMKTEIVRNGESQLPVTES